MQSVVLRAATLNDFKKIKAIALEGWLFSYSYLPPAKLSELVDKYYSEASLKTSLEKVKNGRESFIVAEMNKYVIGFCHVTSKPDKGELLRLYVGTAYIGKGVGKRLMLEGEKFLKAKKCKKYFTFVNMHSKTGMDFYIKNGFVHIQEKDKADEFRNGKVLWYMEKAL